MLNIGPLDIDYDRFLFTDTETTEEEQIEQDLGEEFSQDDIAILGEVISIVNQQKNQSPNLANASPIAIVQTSGAIETSKRTNREIIYLAALAASLLAFAATTALLLMKPTPTSEVIKVAVIVQSPQSATPTGSDPSNQVRSSDAPNSLQLSDAIVRMESNSEARVFFIEGNKESGIKLLPGSLDLAQANTESVTNGDERIAFRLKSFNTEMSYYAIVTPPRTERESVEALVEKANRNGKTQQSLMIQCQAHDPKYQCLTIAIP